MLRLFLILITDDTMYEELMLSKTTPTRAAMDEGAVGDKSDFWAKACSKFLDNDYPVPDFPIVDYPKVFIDDKTNLEYDANKCYSPWVNAADCQLWYKTASNTFATYKKNYDRSGMHTFDTTGGLEEYCVNFCNGEKHAAFFAALLQARGTDCIEHHNGQVPVNAQLEGFVINPPLHDITVDVTSEVMTTSSKHTTYSKTTSAKKAKKQKRDPAELLATALIESMNHKEGKDSSTRKQRDEAALRKEMYMENNEKIKFAGNIELYSKRLLKDTKNKNDKESKVQREIGMKLKKKSIELLADIAGVPYGDKVRVSKRAELTAKASKKKDVDTSDYDSDDIESDSE
jgi:hypothetical protein